MVDILTQPATSRYLIAAMFLLTGILHFYRPGVFMRIIPDYIPWHRPMVYVSGAAELLGAMGIIIPGLQWWAAWGLLLLLVAVFPANIHMSLQAWHHRGPQAWYTIITLLRLPLQFVLIYWVYWAGVMNR